MKKFNQEEFNNFIIKQNIIEFSEEPISLSSGGSSHFYVNWRIPSNDVYLMDQISNYIIAFVKDLNIQPACFYGVEEGATKLGLLTQYKWAKMQPDYGEGVYSLPMGRGKHKTHGDLKDRYYIGLPKGKTVLLEDAITTGNSVILKLDKFTQYNIPVIAVIVLTDRNRIRDDGKSVKEKIEEEGIPYYAMSNALDLLPIIYKKQQPRGEIAKAVEEEFKKYGKDLKLI
jgi:orotate phosphoribosyltransferase